MVVLQYKLYQYFIISTVYAFKSLFHVSLKVVCTDWYTLDFFLRDVYFDFKYSHMYSHIQIGRGNVI